MKLLVECARPRPDDAAIRAAVAAGVDWEAKLPLAGAHGVSGLLFWRLEQAGVEAPREVRARLEESFRATARGNLRLAADLGEIFRWLDAAGIAAVALKGPALVAMLYENLGLRPCSDLDLLVRREELAAAARVLREHGYGEGGAAGAAGLAGNNEMVLCGPTGTVVDLHWSVSPNYFLRFDEGRVWARAEKMTLAGRTVTVLSAEDMFLSLAVHAARHCWNSLHWIGDVARLMERRPFDWDAIRRDAERDGTRRAAAIAAELAREALGAAAPECGDRRALALAAEIRRRLATPGEDFAGTPAGAMMQLRMSERLADRARYLWRRGLVPNQTDNALVALPAPLRPALYAVRPLRILAKAALPAARRLLS